MKKIIAVITLSIILAPTLAFAQATGTQGSSASSISSCSQISGGVSNVMNCALGLLKYASVLLMAAAVVLTIYGAFQMVQSEEKRESGRQTVIYGIIGLFIMISIWGFVNILANTFQLSGNASNFSAPTLEVKVR